MGNGGEVFNVNMKNKKMILPYFVYRLGIHIGKEMCIYIYIYVAVSCLLSVLVSFK